MKDRDLLELESALPQDEETDEDEIDGKATVRKKSKTLEECGGVGDDPNNSVAEESEDNWDVGSLRNLENAIDAALLAKRGHILGQEF